MSLTPTQMMKAIEALSGDASIRLAIDGTWYVNADIGVSDGHVVSGGTEYAATPGDAISKFFHKITNLKPNEHLKTSKGRFKWNGFMWETYAI